MDQFDKQLVNEKLERIATALEEILRWLHVYYPEGKK